MASEAPEVGGSSVVTSGLSLPSRPFLCWVWRWMWVGNVRLKPDYFLGLFAVSKTQIRRIWSWHVSWRCIGFWSAFSCACSRVARFPDQFQTPTTCRSRFRPGICSSPAAKMPGLTDRANRTVSAPNAASRRMADDGTDHLTMHD